MESSKRIIEESPEKKDLLSGFVTVLTALASILTIAPFLAAFFASFQQSPVVAASAPITPPAPVPQMIKPSDYDKPCTLESSNYNVEVSGYLARVTLKQRFKNPNDHKVDGRYLFPLSDRSAVDEMTMKIGNRVIKGDIKERAEAQRIYENARSAGRTASLLEEQRSNIFTQSVANVEPGKSIDITIKYTETLPFKSGNYSLVLPGKVGPRFIPAGCQGEIANINSANTVSSSQAALSVNVSLNEGGIPITKVFSPTHALSTNAVEGDHANVSINSDNSDGRDLVINWEMAAGEMQSGYLAHKNGREGFVSAMIIPPLKVQPNEAAPKEMVFIMDCSGSQAGYPIDKAKETLDYIVDHMNPKDTFQIISFSNTVSTFAKEPVEVSASMKARAHEYIRNLQADGGTVMAPAIEEACKIPAKENRLRIVTLMTDGYIGNDYEIIGMVKRMRGNSRWFPFGTGNGVNRALIDGIAREGGGEAEYVISESTSKDAAEHFYKRIANPVLTNVELSAEGFELADVYPQKASDVWEQRPLYFQARYKKAGKGYLVLKGYSQGKPYVQKLPVTLPEKQEKNSSVSQIWAHSRIEDLSSKDWNGMQSGNPDPELKAEIIKTSLDHRVLSQFTAFVAVEQPAPANMLEKLFNKSSKDQSNGVLQLNKLSTGQRGQAAQSEQSGLSGQGGQSRQGSGGAQAGRPQLLNQSYSTIVNQLNRLNAVPTNTVSSNAGAPDAFDSCSSHSGNYMGSQNMQGGYASAPMLQGATNGSFGPQGYDATVISGINTSATVRVNSLANLEALLNIMANAGQIIGLLAGISLLLSAYVNKKLATAPRRRLLMQSALITLIAVNLPNTVNWTVGLMRDANLFS